MSYQAKLRLASFLTLFLFAMTGTFLLLQATPEGLGLSDDSIAYIAGARSMLAGDGYREAWLASNGPVTHFPPGFSSVLAFFGLFGLDPLRGARFLNALLFGLNTGLLGILAWRMTPSLTAGFVLAGLFIMSGEMLQVHAVAMSEPLFIFLILLSFWMFDLYFERHNHLLWLIACATFTGMAYLTRYAGLALVATFVVALLILHSDWQRRIRSVLIFIAGFLPWALGWAIRNRSVADNITNRVLAWHPITTDNLKIGRSEASQFLIPVETWQREIFKQPYLVELLIVLTLGTVLVWLSLKSWEYISKPQQTSKEERGVQGVLGVIPFTAGLFIFAYLASIVASMTMFDAATKFKLRILSPVYACLFILLIYAGVWLRNKNRPVIIILTIIFLGLSIYKQFNIIEHWSRSGLGYASFQWYDSQAMAYLRELPASVKIYTNEPGAVYLYTERGALVLPDRYDSARGIDRSADFEKGLIVMQQEINSGVAVLALFDHGENIAADVPALTEGLHLVFKAQGDLIYEKP